MVLMTQKKKKKINVKKYNLIEEKTYRMGKENLIAI